MSNYIDLSDPSLFATDGWITPFSELRVSNPVHYVPHSKYGPYWSVVRHEDIMSVLIDNKTYSSMHGITIADQELGTRRSSFIKMDPPEHTKHRRQVSPALSPRSLMPIKDVMIYRINSILDDLVIKSEFDWVETVSSELSGKMLATLLDIPREDIPKLVYWADLALFTDYDACDAIVRTEYEKFTKLKEMTAYFAPLWKVRQSQSVEQDLISALACRTPLEEMDLATFMGQMNLLLIGGFDTIRNALSASAIYACNYPNELDKLRSHSALAPAFSAETIRLHSPIIHLRRTATRDAQLNGKLIRSGDKVVLWLISGNRDEAQFVSPNRLSVDRYNFRRHLDFGAGIHRCPGAQLAEMQITMFWAEVLKRNMRFELLDAPVFTVSNFSRGIKRLKVKVHCRDKNSAG